MNLTTKRIGDMAEQIHPFFHLGLTAWFLLDTIRQKVTALHSLYSARQGPISMSPHTWDFSIALPAFDA